VKTPKRACQTQRRKRARFGPVLKEIDTVLSAIGFRAFEDEKQSELQELSEAVRAESGKLVPNTINVGAAAERFAEKGDAIANEG